MTSGVPYHHSPWMANTVERRRASNAIIAFGQHTRSNNVRRGMPSWSWTPHTIERCRAWHDITALGLHARSDYVGCGRPSSPLGSTHGRTTSGVGCHHSPLTANTLNDVGHGMPSTPLDSTHGRTTSSLTYHHRLWTSHTVERRRAWHAIIAIGQHRRSDHIWRGMPSPPLE